MTTENEQSDATPCLIIRTTSEGLTNRTKNFSNFLLEYLLMEQYFGN